MSTWPEHGSAIHHQVLTHALSTIYVELLNLTRHGGGVLLDCSWLLILDNIDDFKILQSFWPDFDHGSIIITARKFDRSFIGVAPNCKFEQVVSFTPEESNDFIRKLISGHKRFDSETDTVIANFSKSLSHHPLSMSNMASLIIESPNLTLEKYMEETNETRRDLQFHKTESLWYDNSLSCTMDLWFKSLPTGLRTVLTVLAFFDPDRIPEKLLETKSEQLPEASGRANCLSIMASLDRYSIARLNQVGDITGSFFGMHRLVQDTALRVPKDGLQRAFDAAVDLLVKVFPLHSVTRDHMVEQWEECEVFQSHVLALHDRYVELEKKAMLRPSYDFINLIYSCAWSVLVP